MYANDHALSASVGGLAGPHRRSAAIAVATWFRKQRQGSIQDQRVSDGQWVVAGPA